MISGISPCLADHACNFSPGVGYQRCKWEQWEIQMCQRIQLCEPHLFSINKGSATRQQMTKHSIWDISTVFSEAVGRPDVAMNFELHIQNFCITCSCHASSNWSHDFTTLIKFSVMNKSMSLTAMPQVKV